MLPEDQEDDTKVKSDGSSCHRLLPKSQVNN